MTFPLSYELADALKKAGWPQPHGEIADPLPGEWVKESPDGITRQRDLDEKAYSPSLEELIEACPLMLRTPEWGDHYFTLEYWGSISNPWQAKMLRSDWAAVGKSPSEAVARLWLKLKAEDVLK